MTSTPAVDRRPADAPAREDRRSSELHWREEAERVRERVRELRDRARALRERAEDQRAQEERTRRRPGRRPQPRATDRAEALERDAARLEAQATHAEDLLAERARRARALPGWVR